MSCRWTTCVLGVLVAIVGLDARAQTATPAAGVPLDLAARRAALVSDLRYDLALSIPDRVRDPVSGTVEMRFQLADASAPLVVDFDVRREQVHAVRANGRSLEVHFVNGHLVIPAPALALGPNVLHIDFHAGDPPLNRQPDFL